MESTVAAAAAVSLSSGADVLAGVLVTASEEDSATDSGTDADESAAEVSAGADEIRTVSGTDAEVAVEAEAGTDERGAASFFQGYRISKRITTNSRPAKTAPAASSSFRRFRAAGDIFFL